MAAMKIRSLVSDVNPHAVNMNLREQSLKRLLALSSGRLLVRVQKTRDTWFLDIKVKMILYVGLSVRPIQSRHYIVGNQQGKGLLNKLESFFPLQYQYSST